MFLSKKGHQHSGRLDLVSDQSRALFFRTGGGGEARAHFIDSDKIPFSQRNDGSCAVMLPAYIDEYTDRPIHLS